MFEEHPEHPALKIQPGSESTVWRYMDLARFLSLLEEEALWFTQAALLADQWEGYPGGDPRLLDEESSAFQLSAQLRFSQYISSWHISEYQSAAMWQIYQREGRGVAIRSTWDRLKKSILSPWPVFGGKVTYIDYVASSFDQGTWLNGLTPFMHKRMSFAHEQEVRLVLWADAFKGPLFPDPEDGKQVIDAPPQGVGPYPPGYLVEVDLQTMIESIYVDPDGPPWMADLVDKVQHRYGVDFGIVSTPLDSHLLK